MPLVPKHYGWDWPSRSSWVAIASRIALEEGVDPVALLAGDRKRKVARARWKAWAALLAKNEDYSSMGIATVSGFHWTSVLYGLKRNAGYSAAECRKSLAR